MEKVDETVCSAGSNCNRHGSGILVFSPEATIKLSTIVGPLRLGEDMAFFGPVSRKLGL